MIPFDLPAPEPAAPEPAAPSKCRRCHRKISDPVSVGYQIGPDCRHQLGIGPAKRPPRIVIHWTGPVDGQQDLINPEEINEGNPMTGEPKPTLYHDSVDHLRRDLIAGYEIHKAMADKYFAATIRPDIPPTRDAISDARDASAAAYNLSYTLAAVLGFAARKFGDDVAQALAGVADNVLANGDDGDVPHNADVMPAAASGEGETR